MTRARILLSCVLSGLAAALLAAPAGADGLDRVKKSGVLRWGCDAQGGAPYVYKDPNSLNSYIGFEAELAEAIAGSMGVKAERVQNQWDKLVPGLARGDYDIAMNGLEMTNQRQSEVLFSRPYYVSTLSVTGRKVLGAPPTNLSGLRGKTVGCLKETFAERLLESAGGITVKRYDDVIATYIDLHNKHSDAVVMDTPVSLYYAKRPDLDSAGADFGEARYGAAASLGETRLIEAVNRAIDDVIKSGQAQKIFERYAIWNEETAELFGAKFEEPRGDGEMYASFHTRDRSLRARLKLYREALGGFAFAALMTLTLSTVGMAIAVVLGLALALMRLYGPGPVRLLATMYIEGIRGTPLLIQLYIIFYALPDMGLNLPPFVAAVLGLGLNYAAYEAENYRAGITSIALGQTEAAHALGLTHLQTLRYVIVPQALRLVIPPVTNDFIALLKDSSIVSVIAMTELTETYNETASAMNDRIGPGLIAAAFYFALGWPFAKLAAWLEERARRGRR